MVKGMAKVFEPDLVMICLVGVAELDTKILEYLSKQYPEIPVLLLGTADECKCYQKYYESGKFDYVERPTTLSALMKKCMDTLGLVEEEPEKEAQVVVEEQRKKRILAVDDSGILLRSVKTMLDKKYEVFVATDGMTALKQAKKKMPDLILLDYEMPEWDGKKTLEEIRKDDEVKDIPVVFLTSVADKEHIFAVLELKPEGYLLKPIEPQKLIDTIEKVLSGVL